MGEDESCANSGAYARRGAPIALPAPVPESEVLDGIRAGIEELNAEAERGALTTAGRDEAPVGAAITLGHTTAAHVLSAAAADLGTYGGKQYCWGWPELRAGHVPGPYWGMTNYYWCGGAVVRWFYVGSAGAFDLRRFCPNWGAVKYLDAALASGHLPFRAISPGGMAPGDIACEFVNGNAQHTYITRSAVDRRGNYTTYEGDAASSVVPSSENTGGFVNSRVRSLKAMTTGAFRTHIYRPHWWSAPTPPHPAPSTALILKAGMHDPCGAGTSAGVGNHIHALQSGMNKEFPAYRETPLTVDGIYGPHSVAAVEDFQRRARLAVDGVVGPLTARALLAAGVHI